MIRFKNVRLANLKNYYNKTLNSGRIPPSTIIISDIIAIKYQSLTDTLQRERSDVFIGKGSNESDLLYGGADSDGFIMFNDKQINGTKTQVDENTYEDENFTYTQTEGDLYVVDKNLGEYLTITSFENKDLGITLQNTITKVSLETTHTFKDDEYVYVRVLLDQSLQENSEVVLNIFGSPYTTTIVAGDVDSVAAIRLNESWGSTLEIKITDASESLEFEEERVYGVDVVSSNEREEDKYSLYMHDISNVEDELKSFLSGDYYSFFTINTVTLFQNYTSMKINTNNHKTLSICQDDLWHLKMNNKDFKLQTKALS